MAAVGERLTYAHAPLPVLHDGRAQRLLQHSDLAALQAVHTLHPAIVTDAEWTALSAHHEFAMQGPDHYAASPVHGWDRTLEDAEGQYESLITATRWHLVEHTFLSVLDPAKIHRALDFGTFCGAHAIAMAKRFPEAMVYARDIVPALTEPMEHVVQKYAPDPAKIIRQIGDHRGLPGNLDLIYAGEVLEHCLWWEDVIAAFEAACRPGALIVLTTPCGPWEQHEERHLHVQHWERDDLLAAFGKKPSCFVTRLSYSDLGREELGWHLTGFFAGGAKAGRIDIGAKLARWGFPACATG